MKYPKVINFRCTQDVYDNIKDFLRLLPGKTQAEMFENFIKESIIIEIKKLYKKIKSYKEIQEELKNIDAINTKDLILNNLNNLYIDLDEWLKLYKDIFLYNYELI